MNVLWIADFGIKHNIGGAQRTDSFVIQKGLENGYDIKLFNYDSGSESLNHNYDIVVSSNLETLCRRQDVFNFILNHKNHFRYEHDSNSYLTTEARKMLFGSTRKNIFLSDFHYKTFVYLYGDIFNNFEVVSPYIDESKFYDSGQEREDKILSVGYMHFFKGTNNFFNEVLSNPDKQFVFAGWGEKRLERTMKSFSNVEFLGKVSHNDMPKLYNKYTTLYYHPDKFEPFCRAVGEAMFCGIKTDCSNNIGAVYDFNSIGIEKMKENSRHSLEKFWDIINQNKI
jgi:hypothetical protein